MADNPLAAYPQTLLLPEWLVTMDPRVGVLHQGALLIDGPRIAYCGPRALLPPLPPTLLPHELPKHIVLPGLVNTHTHLPMALLRGLADDLPLQTWLEQRIFPAEARLMDAAAVAAGARLAIGELLLGGTTCCADGYFHEHAVLQTAADLGLRGVFAQGVLDLPAPGAPDPAGALEDLTQWLARPPSRLQTPAIFAHSLYTCSPTTLRRAKTLARKHGCLFFIHVAETAWESQWCLQHADGLSPVAALDRLDLLDAQTVLVHAVHVSEGDADCIARRGCAVAINTESNMKLASGVAPLHRFLERGIRVGLGTDGAASNNDLDLFGEMASTARLQKLARQDPATLSANTALHLATAGGAQALGLGDTIGMLRPGLDADLIAVRTDRPHACPLYDPVSHLVYAASAADVDLVWVAGLPRVQRPQGLLPPIADAMAQARALARTIDPHAPHS